MASQNSRGKDHCITPISGTAVDVGPCRPDQELKPRWYEPGPVGLVDENSYHRSGHWLTKLQRGKSVKVAHWLQHSQVSHRVKAHYATGHLFSSHCKDRRIYPGHHVRGGNHQSSCDHETRTDLCPTTVQASHPHRGGQ